MKPLRFDRKPPKPSKESRRFSINPEGVKTKYRTPSEEAKKFARDRRKVDLINEINELGIELMEVWDE